MNKDKLVKYLAFAAVIGWIVYASMDFTKELKSFPHPLPGVWNETHTEVAYRRTIEFSENSVQLGGSWKTVSRIVFDGDSKTGLGKYELYLVDDAFDFIRVNLDAHGLIDVVGVDEAGEYRDGSPRYQSIDYGKYVKR